MPMIVELRARGLRNLPQERYEEPLLSSPPWLRAPGLRPQEQIPPQRTTDDKAIAFQRWFFSPMP